MRPQPVLEVNIPHLPLFHRGKVRDIYDLGDTLLFIATDRVSAFDVILPTGIPGKGKVLTSLSIFWFNQTRQIIPNHFISDNIQDFPPVCLQYKTIIEGRAMQVKKVKPIPVECIVRGYITGSAWQEYKKTQTVCGIKLPPGLEESEKLPEPVFTPSTKAEAGHDINITFSEMENRIGSDLARFLREKSLSIYTMAQKVAREKGFIIADTKLEFGIYNDEVILIDEVLTPDSSRFWAIKNYKKGQPQDSYDKQIIRDYLIQAGWNKKPPAPQLPDHIVKKTAERYEEIMKAFLESS